MNKWRLLKSRTVFARLPWIRVDQNSYQLPNGKIGEDFYQFIRPDYVLIIAIDNNKI